MKADKILDESIVIIIFASNLKSGKYKVKPYYLQKRLRIPTEQ
jgi:hypothetical protein